MKFFKNNSKNMWETATTEAIHKPTAKIKIQQKK
jgi:hypothetical protein